VGDKRKAVAWESWSSDFVPGKGRGQIMLLHGKPVREMMSEFWTCWLILLGCREDDLCRMHS
jgi:hypothetical protein